MVCSKCEREIIEGEEIYQVVIQQSVAPANGEEVESYEEDERGWICSYCGISVW